MEYKCLDVSKVYHRFGSKKEYMGIENANLTLQTGEIVGIIGLSSSGKSTLIELLSGMIKPSSGIINYNGKEISKVYDELGVKLNKNLTVYDNMVYFGKKEKMSELDVENRMAQLRDIFTLNKYINTKASELNNANRVKAELAMLLLKSPRMLFIDDSFLFLNNLDRNEVLKCLKRLNKQERTIIVISGSNVSDVEKIVNRIIITDKNKIVYDDTIENFKNKYCTKKEFEIYLNKNVSISKIEGVEVIESSDYYFKLLFDNKEGMFANVINLFDVNNIVDLSVRNQPLSDLIEKIKKDGEK
jgi:ABC-2 type transport system ATP-binding protein